MSESPDTSITEKFSLRAKSFGRPKDDWQNPVSGYGAAYFQVLVAEYRALCGQPGAEQPPPGEQRLAAMYVLEELAARPVEKVMWSDLLVFESMLPRLQTRDALAIELLLIRSEYKELIGGAAYEGLKFPAIDVPFKNDEDYLKALAEYQALLQELHWNYLSGPAKEYQRAKLLLWLSCSLGILLLFAWFCVRTSQGGVLAALVICGALGAWLSAFQRAHSAAIHSAVLLNLRRSRLAKLSFGLAPWIGALSALILAFVFASGIISGKVFPLVRWTSQLDTTETNAVSSAAIPQVKPLEKPQPPAGAPAPAVGTQTGASALKTNSQTAGTAPANANAKATPVSQGISNDDIPKTPLGWRTAGGEKWHFGRDTEYSLLLVWAFIAGFSERFVPDLLNRIARKTDGA